MSQEKSTEQSWSRSHPAWKAMVQILELSAKEEGIKKYKLLVLKTALRMQCTATYIPYIIGKYSKTIV